LKRTAGCLRTVFALSLPSSVVRIFIQRGNGFLWARYLFDATPCSVTPDKHAPIRPTDVCFPILLDYEHPYSLVPGASLGLAPEAERRVLGTHRVAGGEERSRRSVVLRFGVPHPPLWGVTSARGVLFPSRSMRPTSDALVATPLRFSMGIVPRLRVGPPGLEPPRTTLSLARDCPQERMIRERLLSIGAISRERGLRLA
jgi:hypothetical protein